MKRLAIFILLLATCYLLLAIRLRRGPGRFDPSRPADPRQAHLERGRFLAAAANLRRNFDGSKI